MLAHLNFKTLLMHVPPTMIPILSKIIYSMVWLSLLFVKNPNISFGINVWDTRQVTTTCSMLTKQYIDGVPKFKHMDSVLDKCPTCIRAKQTKEPAGPNTTRVATQPPYQGSTIS
eukprot:scaffold24183_cov269-Cylindrotheca_fusiformis.AAC.1